MKGETVSGCALGEIYFEKLCIIASSTLLTRSFSHVVRFSMRAQATKSDWQPQKTILKNEQSHHHGTFFILFNAVFFQKMKYKFPWNGNSRKKRSSEGKPKYFEVLTLMVFKKTLLTLPCL